VLFHDIPQSQWAHGRDPAHPNIPELAHLVESHQVGGADHDGGPLAQSSRAHIVLVREEVVVVGTQVSAIQRVHWHGHTPLIRQRNLVCVLAVGHGLALVWISAGARNPVDNTGSPGSAVAKLGERQTRG